MVLEVRVRLFRFRVLRLGEPITVGTDLKPIIEITIPYDVVEPLYASSQEYKFGKSTWGVELFGKTKKRTQTWLLL